MKTDRFIQQHKPLHEDRPVSFYVMWQGTTYAMPSRDFDAVAADIADASEYADGAHTIFARTPDGDVPVMIFRGGMGEYTKAGKFMVAEGQARCEQEQDRPFNGLTNADITAGAARYRSGQNVLAALGGVE